MALTLFEGSLAWMPEIESVPRRPMARTPNKSITPKKTCIAVIAINFLLSEEDRILKALEKVESDFANLNMIIRHFQSFKAQRQLIFFRHNYRDLSPFNSKFMV